jgi:hypothetical protein
MRKRRRRRRWRRAEKEISVHHTEMMIGGQLSGPRRRGEEKA